MTHNRSFSFANFPQKPHTNSAELLEWLQAAKDTITANEATINELVEEKQNLSNLVRELQDDLGSGEKEDAQLQIEINQLIHQLEKKESQNQELERVNEFLQNELTNLQEQVNQQIRNQKKKRNSIEQEHILTDLKNTLEEKEGEINNLRQRFAELVTKQRDCRSKQQKLEQELDQNLNQEAQYKKEITKYQAQIQYLQEKKKQLETEQEKLLTELQPLKERESIFLKDLAEKEQKIAELQALLNTRERELDDLSSKLKDKENDVSLSEYQALKNETEESKKDYQFMVQKYEDLLTNLKVELGQTKKDKAKLEQELKDNKQDINSKGYGEYIFKIGGWSLVIGVIILGGWWLIKKLHFFK